MESNLEVVNLRRQKWHAMNIINMCVTKSKCWKASMLFDFLPILMHTYTSENNKDETNLQEIWITVVSSPKCFLCWLYPFAYKTAAPRLPEDAALVDLTRNGPTSQF